MEEIQAEAKLPEKTETIQQQTNEKSIDIQETPQQIDWKKFKEARRLERIQAEEIAKKAAAQEKENTAMKAAMEALLNKPTTQNSQDANQEETDEGRTRRLINEALAGERKRVDEENRKREHAEYPQRLAQTYNDFDQVCTSENLDYLEFHHPEIALAYRQMPDGFEKWQGLYKLVKKHIPNSASNKDQKKAEKNFGKPQSMAVGGNTQTLDTAPINLTDQRRNDNWNRMQRVMKGIK